ncbi:MAG: hypothetical protein Q9212_006718 [Teloschistes hypoglaucus]
MLRKGHSVIIDFSTSSLTLCAAVTGAWTLPFTAYLLFLSNRVVYQRIKNKQFMGDKLNSDNSKGTENTNMDPLFLENRCHQNFLENVPLAFTLAAIAELNGADRTILNYALAALFALRIGHVELGIRGKDAMGPGRLLGLLGSQAFLGVSRIRYIPLTIHPLPRIPMPYQNAVPIGTLSAIAILLIVLVSQQISQSYRRRRRLHASSTNPTNPQIPPSLPGPHLDRPAEAHTTPTPAEAAWASHAIA